MRTTAFGVITALALSTLLHGAAPGATAIADAAMAKDNDAVRSLLKQGGDVNAAQGDGMTALHWAAMHGDAALTGALLYAGGNVQATTRLGGYTPLHLASQTGTRAVVDALVGRGADVNARATTGATPLMFAASAGNSDALQALLDHGADANAAESANGQTALMFGAAADRATAVRLLLTRGASPGLTSKVVDLAGVTAPEDKLQQEIRDAQTAKSAKTAADAAAAGAAAGRPMPASPRAAPATGTIAGVTRAYTYNELIGKQGGLSALHFAARQGGLQTVNALVAAGADVNQVSPADQTSPLLIATINGQFDIAARLLELGADPNLASEAGIAPLYAVLNVEWAPKAFYPQPRASLQQNLSYLDLARALLDKGADPNLRLKKKIWYTQYNFDLLRIDEGGATPFWRAAYASDIAAMKMLLTYGADPRVPTSKPAGRTRVGDNERESRDISPLPQVPVGGPGVPPLLAAAGPGYGEGFAANAHRFAPGGMLAAVKYLVEELHADVNATDAEGNTAVHNAAARGDNDMIQYLVAKGADVTRINRAGQTTVDMANGPAQRTQPYPETIKLLEGLGAKNNHKCVSC
jgi:ankyrin repeat protein